jgi:hypothetical protein
VDLRQLPGVIQVLL